MSTPPIGEALIRIRIDSQSVKSTQEEAKEKADPVGKRGQAKVSPGQEIAGKAVDAATEALGAVGREIGRNLGITRVSDLASTAGRVT